MLVDSDACGGKEIGGEHKGVEAGGGAREEMEDYGLDGKIHPRGVQAWRKADVQRDGPVS